MHEAFSGRYECGLVFVYDGKVPPAGNCGRVSHDTFSAWLLRHGQVVVETSGSERAQAGAGLWVIPPVGLPRTQMFSPDAEMLSICFRAETRNGGLAYDLKKTLRIPAAKYPALEKRGVALAKAAKGLLDLPLNPGAKGVESLHGLIRVQACFWTWLESMEDALSGEGVEAKAPKALDPRVRAMAAFLETQPSFGGGPVPYESLERLGGLGRVQIDRLFLRDLGMTPRGFLERKAVSLAKELLLDGSVTVKELSCKLGFSSSAHFCAWFKRNVGRRPSEHRALRPV